MSFDWKKLYKAVDMSRGERSWRVMAKEGGLTPSSFTRLHQGKAISVVNLLKVLHVSGIGLMGIMSFVKQARK